MSWKGLWEEKTWGFHWTQRTLPGPDGANTQRRPPVPGSAPGLGHSAEAWLRRGAGRNPGSVVLPLPAWQAAWPGPLSKEAHFLPPRARLMSRELHTADAQTPASICIHRP